MEQKQIDYSPLGSKVGYKDFLAQGTEEGFPGAGMLAIGFALGFIGAAVSFPLMMAGKSPGVSLFALLLGVVLFTAGVWKYVLTLNGGIRLKRFAAANDLEYHPTTTPTEQGILFQLGRDRHSNQVVSGQYHGREFWFGTHYYTVGSGKNRRTVATTVLNVSLPRAVPHVIIDGRQNRLPIGGEFDRSQRLALEGDFNKYFTVYCPKDYERDVLYFLTPELMQALVDMPDKFDVEMRDHELYFYSNSAIKVSESWLQELFGLIDTIGGEVSENIQRYQDWRVAKGLDAIAPGGIQLKRSIWPSIFAGVVILIYIIAVITN